MCILDRILFCHRNRFYRQDTPSPLQARQVGDSPNLGPSPPLHQVSILLYPPSLTRPLGYCRTRTLLFPFLRVFPRRGCCHPRLRRQLARPRRCALLTTGGRSFVRPHPSATTKVREIEDYCLVVVGNKADLVSSSEGRAVSEEAALDFIDELVPLSGSSF